MSIFLFYFLFNLFFYIFLYKKVSNIKERTQSRSKSHIRGSPQLFLNQKRAT